MAMNDVLVWLMSAAGAIACVSWAFERMSWFQNLSSEAKEWTMFAGSALVALAARAVVVYVPADMLTQIAPWFEMVVAIFVTLFLSKGFHKVDKA